MATTWSVADSWEREPHQRGLKPRVLMVLSEDTAEASVCWVAEIPTTSPECVHARELANAKLIAAAPELFRALKELRDNVDDLSGFWTESTSNFIQQADAALAKSIT